MDPFCSLRWRKRREHFLRILVICLCLLFAVIFALAIINIGLPDISIRSNKHNQTFGNRQDRMKLGLFGEMMIRMLPDDLAFTVFLPSEAAFRDVLNLNLNDSLVEERQNETYAILSRVMGFSAVPQHVTSVMVHSDEEIVLDSVSGFRLCFWRTSTGILMVNNIQSEVADLRRGEIIIHVMSGVLMDAEFEQSFTADYDD